MCVCVCVCVCVCDEYYNSLYTALPSNLAPANIILRMVLQGVGALKNITGLEAPNA